MSIERTKLEEFMLNDIEIAVFLTNGIKLTGFLRSQSSTCIVINKDQLIYKHAISTIQPNAR